MKIGKNIKRLRHRADMTQLQLAEKTGFGVTRISDLERDRYEAPDTTTLETLASALNATLDELLVDEAFYDELTTAEEIAATWPFMVSFREVIEKTDAPPKRKAVWEAYYDTILRRAGTFIMAFNHGVASWETVTKERFPGRDLICPPGTPTSALPPKKGESDVPASAREIDRLQEERDDYRTRLREAQDAARRLVVITALSEEERAPSRARTKSSRHRRKAS